MILVSKSRDFFYFTPILNKTYNLLINQHSNILGKVDSYVEQVARKLAVYMNDVMKDQKDKVLENLLANGMDLPTYLTRFQWDMAKYPIKQSLKNLSDIIGKDNIIKH